MAPSLFLDKASPPSAEEAPALFCELEEALRERFVASGSWAWSGRKAGWTYRLARGRQPFVYLTPCEGFVRASFALSERARAAAGGSGLPPGLVALIEQAPRYPEGRAVRVEVQNAAVLPELVRLAELKLAG